MSKEMPHPAEEKQDAQKKELADPRFWCAIRSVDLADPQFGGRLGKKDQVDLRLGGLLEK